MQNLVHTRTLDDIGTLALLFIMCLGAYIFTDHTPNVSIIKKK